MEIATVRQERDHDVDDVGFELDCLQVRLNEMTLQRLGAGNSLTAARERPGPHL